MAAATLALLACGAGEGEDISGPPDPPSESIFGTWVLESVSGEGIPARVNQYRDAQLDLIVKTELVRGLLTLKHDQTFEYAFVIRATVGSIVGPDILVPAEGVFQGGAWVRTGNVLHRVRGPGQPADSGADRGQAAVGGGVSSGRTGTNHRRRPDVGIQPERAG